MDIQNENEYAHDWEAQGRTRTKAPIHASIEGGNKQATVKRSTAHRESESFIASGKKNVARAVRLDYISIMHLAWVESPRIERGQVFIVSPGAS